MWNMPMPTDHMPAAMRYFTGTMLRRARPTTGISISIARPPGISARPDRVAV